MVNSYYFNVKLNVLRYKIVQFTKAMCSGSIHGLQICKQIVKHTNSLIRAKKNNLIDSDNELDNEFNIIK